MTIEEATNVQPTGPNDLLSPIQLEDLIARVSGQRFENIAPMYDEDSFNAVVKTVDNFTYEQGPRYTPEEQRRLDPFTVAKAKLTVLAKLKLAVDEAKRSPIGLYKLLFSSPDGDEITIKWFHEEWQEMVLKNRAVQIEASRGTAKTSMMLACVLWFMGKNPDVRIKWVGPNDGNAQKRLQFIRSTIVESKLYQAVFPHVMLAKDKRLPNNVQMLTLERSISSPECTVEAKGIMSSSTGDRCEILVADDIADEKNSMLEPATREKVKHKFLNEWLPTLMAKGRVWAIFTPWSPHDVNAYLKKHAGWTYKKFAHGKPKDPVHSIFPELWPRSSLEERRRWLGRTHYARAYLCKEISEDTIAIRPQDLVHYSALDLTQEKLQRSICIISVDPASGKDLQRTSKLDYCGFSIALLVPPPEPDPDENTNSDYYQADEDTMSAASKKRVKDITEDIKKAHLPPPFEIFIVDAYQIRLSTKLQVLHLADLCKQWRPEYICAEDQGVEALSSTLFDYQSQYPETITADVYPIKVGAKGKGQRLLQITPYLEEHAPIKRITKFHPRVIDPEPEPYQIVVNGLEYEALRNLRDQWLNFGTTRHDDTGDSAAQNLNFIRQYLAPDYQVAHDQASDGVMTGFIPF